MARYIELYSNTVNNAEIAASGTAIYCETTTDQERKAKHGSYNALLLQNNDSSIDIKVELDGLSDRTILIPAKNNLEIRPDEGIGFDTLKVTNLDSSNALAANKLYIRYAVSEYAGG